MLVVPWGALIVFFNIHRRSHMRCHALSCSLDIRHQSHMRCHALSRSLNRHILSRPHTLHLDLHVSVHPYNLSKVADRKRRAAAGSGRHGACVVDLLRNDGAAIQRGGMGGKAGRWTMMVARAQTAELWQ